MSVPRNPAAAAAGSSAVTGDYPIDRLYNTLKGRFTGCREGCGRPPGGGAAGWTGRQSVPSKLTEL